MTRSSLPHIGVMAAGGEESVEGFLLGLRENGLFQGRDFRVTSRTARADPNRLTTFAQEFVQARVDLIVTVGAIAARAACSMTREIPIVFAVVVDPVHDHLVANPAGSGSNVTGVTTFDPGQADIHLRLLRLVVPDLQRVAILADRDVSDCLAVANVSAARRQGVQPIPIQIAGPCPDLAAAFTAMRSAQAQALIVLQQPVNGVCRESIAAMALGNRLPTIMAAGAAVEGCLFSFATSLHSAARRMAGLAATVLAGSNPSALPIQTWWDPELVVHLKTARRLPMAIAEPQLVSQVMQITAEIGMKAIANADRSAAAVDGGFGSVRDD